VRPSPSASSAGALDFCRGKPIAIDYCSVLLNRIVSTYFATRPHRMRRRWSISAIRAPLAHRGQDCQLLRTSRSWLSAEDQEQLSTSSADSEVVAVEREVTKSGMADSSRYTFERLDVVERPKLSEASLE
jgi:hypothetical protein